MATLSDFYLGDPRLNQYYLGSGMGSARFNQNYRPTVQQYMAGRSRPGPESLYRRQPSPLAADLGTYVPTQMGDFTPSARLMGDVPQLRFNPQVQATPQAAPMYSESEEGQIAAAGARFKTPNELGFMPGGSREPVVIKDRMAQDNPNYRAEPAQESGAAPRRTLGLLGDMFGGASALDEYMTPEQRAQLQNQGVMAAAMQLLAASGPSRTPVGLGQALGEAYGAGQKGYTAAQQNLLTSMTMKQKMDEYKREVADQEAYWNLMGGGQVGAQPTGVITPDQAMNAPGLPAGPTVARAAMIGAPSAGAAPTGLASLTQEQRMILSRLPAKEGYKEALRLMEQKTESVPDDIKKLKALNLPITLDNLLKLNPAAAAQDPEKIRILRALNLPLTLEGLRSLDPQNPEANPTEIRILNATGTAVTFDNVMKLRQSGASQTSVKVDTGQKTRDVEINKDIVREMGDMTAQARSAKETLMNVDRVLPALDKAITGPAADYRTTLLRVGQYMGIAGKDANEILSNTQSVVQGLAQQELNAASYTKGQGTLTGPEREMLKRSAAGDQNMSAAELRTALIAAQKMAQYRMSEQQQYLSEFKKLPGSEQYIPFYTVAPYQSAGSGNAAQNAIDAELARRARQQRGGGMR